MPGEPLITVVVPTFNSARFLPDTIHSLERQAFRDFEVIVSDGGSTDGTIALLKAARLPNLRIDSRPDAGVPDALNRGFALARGRVLCWLNSDDLYVSPHALQRAAEAFRRSGVAFAYGHTLLLNEAGRVTRELYAHIPRRGFEHEGTNLMTGSMFFSRVLWAGFQGFSGQYRFGFEYEIIRHLYETATRPSLIDDFLCGFRIHAAGISTRARQEMAVETRQALSGVPRHGPWLGKAERLLSQAMQGTLPRAIGSKFRSARVSRHWAELYGEDQGAA